MICKFMNYILYTLLFFITPVVSLAQDFDVYPHAQDDKVKMPYVHESMKLKEFQVLSREIRMMDMTYALIIPGYVHFKAQEKTKAYVLLALRSAAYIGLTSVYISSKVRGDTFWGGITNTNTPEEQINLAGQWILTTSDLVEGLSIFVIITTYLYDWIHGKFELERKQELIRYKYSIKLKLEHLNYNNGTSQNYTPNISFSYYF